MIKEIRLVIFDLDGTLIDAYAAIADSFNHVMRRMGLPIKPAGVIRKAVGGGDANLLRPFVPVSDLKRALVIYRRHHASALRGKSRLLPGAAGLMEDLRKRGIRMAVASNRPTRFSRILLEYFGLDKRFAYVLCADKLKKGKPDPLILRRILRKLKIRPENALYVGDMDIDALTGRRAGVRTAIVLTGSGERKEIRSVSPWKIVRNLEELRKILTRLALYYKIKTVGHI
ncbi:MAG: HAD family hydrolase [Candidatus Omnitrophota bacterium]|jgi:phosphoglycolate phosphatase